jgi:hypothetical protein
LVHFSLNKSRRSTKDSWLFSLISQLSVLPSSAMLLSPGFSQLMPPLAPMNSKELFHLRLSPAMCPISRSGTFKFLFDCPVTSTKTEEKDHHYSTNSGTHLSQVFESSSTTLSSEPSPSYSVSCHQEIYPWQRAYSRSAQRPLALLPLFCYASKTVIAFYDPTTTESIPDCTWRSFIPSFHHISQPIHREHVISSPVQSRPG